MEAIAAGMESRETGGASEHFRPEKLGVRGYVCMYARLFAGVVRGSDEVAGSRGETARRTGLPAGIGIGIGRGRRGGEMESGRVRPGSGAAGVFKRATGQLPVRKPRVHSQTSAV